MPLFRYSAAGLEPVDRTTLALERIRERDDLQRVLRQRIEILGEDLLIVAEEYGLFEDSRRRIDLLAVDRTGTLVVIELKRTDDGGHMELQALRYAAMVSTMQLDHLVGTFAGTHQVSPQEARQMLTDWVEEPFEELPNSVRIILVSLDFSTEITSTVIWLNENYNTDIACHRIVAYRLGEEVLLDLQQIIPLPEAKDFQIQQRQKGAASTAVRAVQSSRDFSRYDLAIGDYTQTSMSKQAAIKVAIQHLFRAGVSVAQIRAVLRKPMERRSPSGAGVRRGRLRTRVSESGPGASVVRPGCHGCRRDLGYPQVRGYRDRTDADRLGHHCGTNRRAAVDKSCGSDRRCVGFVTPPGTPRR